MASETPPERPPTPPTVSVLMTTYNQQDYVGEAIAAVLAQDAPPFEFIISDDCSTDATWDRVTEALADYTGPHRVRLVRNERNLGLNGNLNRMIATAGGDILICAAGDDISTPDRVFRVVATFVEHSPLLVYSGFKPLPLPGQTYDGRFDRLTFDRTTDPVAIAGSTALFVGATAAWHRDLFTLFGSLPEDNVYEDLILGFRAALAGRVERIDAPLVIYRIDVGVTAKAQADLTRSDWTARHLVNLKRHAATFAHRRADALRFGLASNSPVVRAVDRHILSNSIRQDYWLLPTAKLLLKHWRHPVLVLRRIRSERRRIRRALKR